MNAPAKTPEPQDEVEKSRAPLLDHLTELRTRLIRSVLALIVCFFVVFAFSKPILEIMSVPYQNAYGLYDGHGAEGHGFGEVLENAGELINRMLGRATPAAAPAAAPAATPAPDAPASAVPAPQPAPAPEAIIQQPGAISETADPAGPATPTAQLIATGPLEVFLVKVKLSLIGALAIGFPIVAWQLYAFVAPGLYKRERGALIPFLLAMPVLFVLGGLLVYYIILPLVMSFALSQQIQTEGVSVALMVRVNEYFGLVTALLLAFGCMFQLPVVLTLLGKAGVVTARGLRKAWRFAVVGVFVVAAVVTPPDMISQILLALPMLLLYEISIWSVKLVERGRAKREAEEAVGV